MACSRMNTASLQRAPTSATRRPRGTHLAGCRGAPCSSGYGSSLPQIESTSCSAPPRRPIVPPWTDWGRADAAVPTEQSHARLRLNNATRLSRIDWLWSAKRASVGSRRNCRRVKQGHPLMRIYIIGSDGITLCRKAPATLNDGEIAVASNEELHAAPLNAKRLLALWNALPGVEKRKKVGDRDALIDQLWSAIELLPVPEPQPDPKRPSKQDVMIAMLRQPEGATVDEVASVTGWQRHTVRGVFSGTLKKKLGLTLFSAKEERGRVYRIAEPASV